ncbi:MAG: winged helix-turn-helix domain-containing protein [Candidatus Hydrothermarchaeales archaeon]
MKNIFFQEKSKSVLLELEGSRGAYVSEIARGIEGTYAHTFNLIKEMEKMGIVSSRKEGRTKHVSLTIKGAELAKLLRSFLDILKATEVKTKPKTRKKLTTIPSESEEKLQNYVTALESLAIDITAKKIEKGTAARILGRYRSLITRSRPRSKKGRALKDQANEMIVMISEDLSSLQ